jgi:hypothetical protein
MPVINLDEYKEYAGITNPKEDDKLEILVEYAGSFVEMYCNTKFSPVSISEERNYCFNSEIMLQELPVISVDEVRVMSGKTLLGVLPFEDYLLEPAQGIVTVVEPSISIPDTNLNVSVDYTYGYREVPPTVKLAAMEIVTYFSKREFNKSRNIGNGETAQFADPNIIPTHIRASLDLYRRL